MANDLVLRRIDQWEAASVIDPDTAARLRAAEGAEATTEAAEAAEAAEATTLAVTQPATRGEPLITAVEVFGYLGAVFALASWYAFAAQAGITDGAGYGAITLVAAGALTAAAIALRGRSWRARRGAGVALLVATANVATGVGLLLLEALPEAADDTIAFLGAALAAFGAALAFRWLVPARTTHFALGLAGISTAAAALVLIEHQLFPARINMEYGALVDPNQELVLAVGTIVYWIAASVALAIPLVLVPGSGPGREDRLHVGRILVGLTVVGGVAAGAFATYPWWASTDAGESVLPAWLGALLVGGTGAILVGLSLSRSVTAYLLPGGLAICGALSYLNGMYLVEATGLWVALLVEAGVLLGVGLAIRRLRGTVRGEHPKGTPPTLRQSPPTAVA